MISHEKINESYNYRDMAIIQHVTDNDVFQACTESLQMVNHSNLCYSDVIPCRLQDADPVLEET